MPNHQPPTQYPGKEYYFGKPCSTFAYMVPAAELDDAARGSRDIARNQAIAWFYNRYPHVRDIVVDNEATITIDFDFFQSCCRLAFSFPPARRAVPRVQHDPRSMAV